MVSILPRPSPLEAHNPACLQLHDAVREEVRGALSQNVPDREEVRGALSLDVPDRGDEQAFSLTLFCPQESQSKQRKYESSC